MYKCGCVSSVGSNCLLDWVVRALWLCLGCHGYLSPGHLGYASQDPFSRIYCFRSSCRMGSCILPIVLQREMLLPSPTPALEKVQMWALSSRLVVPQHTHTQHGRLQTPVPQHASPIFSKQSTSPTWSPHLNPHTPLQARISMPAKPAPLGTHPPLSPQPRPFPDTPDPGLPRSFSRLSQKAQQLPSALRPPLPERGLDLSQPAHPALVGRGPDTRRRRGICSCPPPQPRPHGRRGRAPGGWKRGGLAAPRPARDARDGQRRVYGCAPRHWPPAWSPGSLLFGRGFVVEGPARVRPGVGALPGSGQGRRCRGQGGIWHLSIMWPQSGLTWGVEIVV